MAKFESFREAETAAKEYFKEYFGHNSGVGVESADGVVVEFYSKEDPDSDLTYMCVVDEDQMKTSKIE